MQGRLQGKRFAAGHFLDDVVTARHRGVQLPAGGRRRHEHGRRLRDVVVGARLRRLRHGARPVDACACLPWHPGTAFCVADVEWADGSPVVAVAAPDPPAPVRAPRRARLARARRHRARVHRLQRHLRAGLDRPAIGTSRRRTSTTSTTRCSAPAASSRCCGGSATRWAMPACGSSRPRASATSASTRSPSATPGSSTKADEHALFKMGAKEIARPGGLQPHLHGEVRRPGGQLLPHPHLASRRARTSPCSPATGEHGFSAVFEHFIAGLLATLRELTLFVAPNINSYKRFVPGSFAPTALAWGHDNRTCALARRRAPARRAAGRVPRARAAT